MHIANTVTFENDAFTMTCKVPTLATVQPLLDFIRPYIARAKEPDALLLPSADELAKAVEAVRPFIDSLVTTDGEAIDPAGDIPVQAAVFLTAVALQLHTICFSQTELKKK